MAIVLVVADASRPGPVFLARTFCTPSALFALPLDVPSTLFARVALAACAFCLTRVFGFASALDVARPFGLPLAAVALGFAPVVLVSRRMVERRQRAERDGQSYDPGPRFEGAHGRRNCKPSAKGSGGWVVESSQRGPRGAGLAGFLELSLGSKPVFATIANRTASR